ncbi:TPA: hypothetical protein ACH3X2_006822 [Trebouxia sp. C0005]
MMSMAATLEWAFAFFTSRSAKLSYPSCIRGMHMSAGTAVLGLPCPVGHHLAERVLGTVSPYLHSLLPEMACPCHLFHCLRTTWPLACRSLLFELTARRSSAYAMALVV